MSRHLSRQKPQAQLHTRGQARLWHVACPDPQKVLGVAVNIDSWDDKGLAYLCEKMIPCGSQKYPLENPWGRLPLLDPQEGPVTQQREQLFSVHSRQPAELLRLAEVMLEYVFRPALAHHHFLEQGWRQEVVSGIMSYRGVLYEEQRAERLKQVLPTLRQAFGLTPSTLGRSILEASYE
jgi:Zn-dependent M16 (insulinase) family peptidase